MKVSIMNHSSGELVCIIMSGFYQTFAVAIKITILRDKMNITTRGTIKWLKNKTRTDEGDAPCN